MSYRPEDGHGLPRNPFKAIVTPRPVGWMSSRDVDGTERIAPYSFFNAVADEPPQVMFASTGAKADQETSKDSVSNIRRTGVFCVNIVEFAMRNPMNATSGDYGRDVDEFEQAGPARAPCTTIPCSRVDGAPAALECRPTEVARLRGEANGMVPGEVKGIHLRNDCLSDGRFDVLRYQPLARLGYRDCSRITGLFEMIRPSD
ncbi:MAG: flavin reductase family protein [Boseongicola sp.]|nr:flavin reductase family protein [Boseongicola sp.]